ncbi:unnamed protein product [Microthlaspi erraticum]|uniref:Uncharacterized protein n=1 Tax=Microthlaspi erraticum TaxID=1685480 RepID=A0A6D2IJK8_9BRAS|nr:unnamed protein product [Microthlaspi erraticum]
MSPTKFKWSQAKSPELEPASSQSSSFRISPISPIHLLNHLPHLSPTRSAGSVNTEPPLLPWQSQLHPPPFQSSSLSKRTNFTPSRNLETQHDDSGNLSLAETKRDNEDSPQTLKPFNRNPLQYMDRSSDLSKIQPMRMKIPTVDEKLPCTEEKRLLEEILRRLSSPHSDYESPTTELMKNGRKLGSKSMKGLKHHRVAKSSVKSNGEERGRREKKKRKMTLKENRFFPFH